MLVIMPFLHRLAALSLCAFLLASCDPPKELDVEAAVSKLEKERGKSTRPSDSIPSGPGLLEAATASLSAKDDRVEIVLLLPDARVALQEFQRNGLTMLVGRQVGYKLTTQDAAGSAAKQLEQFQQAVAAKPAAIIVSPIDPAALAAVIVEASTAGSLVVGLDKRMLNEGCASIVFSDQRLVGRMAAQTILDALKRKADEEKRTEVTGRVLQLRGAENSLASNEFAAGVTEVLQTQPGVILVHDAPTDWSTENATRRTEEAFRLQKNFDAICAHSDAIALGAAKAAENASLRDNIYITGADGLAGPKRGVDLVRQGDIDATIVQPALVDLALKIIVKMRADKTFKPLPAYEIQPVAIVPRNIEAALRNGTYKLPAL